MSKSIKTADIRKIYKDFGAEVSPSKLAEELNKILEKPKVVTIELKEYNYDCADGCCTHFGTKVIVNDEEMPFRNQDIETILDQVLKHLNFAPEIINYYNDEEI